MGTEIERKFLVTGDHWKSQGPGVPYRQGYLGRGHNCVIRVRTMGDRAALTVKGAAVGATRPEFEYDIPLEDARQLLDLCPRPLIEKTRRRIEYHGLIWEVDEFHGENEGLVIAECELESEDQAFDIPAWVGDEVTGDPRYHNSNLGENPFGNW